MRKAHGTLSGVLAMAVRDRRLVINPAVGVALPPLRERRRRYLTPSQVEALADVAGEHGRLPVLVLAYCGLRWGELVALRVRNVDVLRRRLAVEEAAIEINGGRMEWGTPKSNERRSVPLPAFLAAELDAAVHGRSGEELVFTSPLGTVLRNRNARSQWFDAGQHGNQCRRKRQGRPANARTCLRRHDSRPVRGPVQRGP